MISSQSLDNHCAYPHVDIFISTLKTRCKSSYGSRTNNTANSFEQLTVKSPTFICSSQHNDRSVATNKCFHYVYYIPHFYIKEIKLFVKKRPATFIGNVLY